MSSRLDEEAVNLLDDSYLLSIMDNPDKRNRKVNRTSSVIIPNTGERVHRSITFSEDTNTTFESFQNPSPFLRATSTPAPASLQPVRFTTSVLLYVQNLWFWLINVYKDEKFRTILKCSLSYLIASLAVYWGPFNRLLGNSDFKHVVSTVVVYFHPTRTKGSMHITLVYVIISIAYSFTVSFGCRFLSASFYNNGNEEVSYAIDLIISSVSLGVVSFMKQKVNKETFNTACSLASISIVACVIKEGSLNGAIIPIDRLVATLRIVVTGCAISVGICYVLWPKSAVDLLKKELNDTTNVMSSVLSVLTSRFITGERLSDPDNAVFNKMNSKIKQIQKLVLEAKYELYVKGKENEWKHLNRLADITIGLSQHLKALRSSTEMQTKLLHDLNSDDHISTSSLKSYKSQFAISESVENLAKINEQLSSGDLDYTAINSSQMFDLFVYYLSPSTKAFVFTLKTILSEVPFNSKEGKYEHFSNTKKFQQSLSLAIELYDGKQVDSFNKLYDQKSFKSNTDFLFKSDLEEVTACCGNFSSLLKFYGEELLHFLQILDEKPNEQKSWNWLKFWKSSFDSSDSKTNKYSSNLNDALFHLQNQYNFRAVSREDPNIRNSTMNYLSHKLWQFLKIFKRTDIQFGIRVGIGAFILSLSAFHPRTKFLFNSWRGEWSLTIYCIMMNKSLGGTQMTVKWRILGTFLGCMIAWVVWQEFDGHPVALGLTGFVLSLYCFYIILYWESNNAFGRFILLTYNLTALYSYTQEQHDAEDDNEGGDSPIVLEIAFHRFISVSIGIIWALTMASIFIPNSARSRIKAGLTILWLRIGVIWNSDPLDYKFDEADGTYRLISLKGGEHALNQILSELEVLIKQAPMEFRLKGQFPTEKYSSLIKSTSKIIDALHNMILLIEIDAELSANEEFVIKYIEAERHELEHRIFLIFYMIASSMKLQFPLPSKPASTEHAKDRLLYKLSEIRANSGTSSLVLNSEDYVLLYSYILVTNIITQELDSIISVIKQLTGDISEDMFQLV